MVAGAIVAALFGLCLGYPSFRLKGVYFKLVTFVSSLILEIICRLGPASPVAIQGYRFPSCVTPDHVPIASPTPYFYIILAMTSLYFLFTRRILQSRFGYYLQALRDDQVAAEVLGINSLYMKLTGFALSAILTALVGTFTPSTCCSSTRRAPSACSFP